VLFRSLRHVLAMAYDNLGTALNGMGNQNEAVKNYCKAIELFQILIDNEGRKELQSCLAITYNNRANALGDQGKLGESVADFSRSIEILQSLIETEDREELRSGGEKSAPRRSFSSLRPLWVQALTARHGRSRVSRGIGPRRRTTRRLKDGTGNWICDEDGLSGSGWR